VRDYRFSGAVCRVVYGRCIQSACLNSTWLTIVPRGAANPEWLLQNRPMFARCETYVLKRHAAVPESIAGLRVVGQALAAAGLPARTLAMAFQCLGSLRRSATTLGTLVLRAFIVGRLHQLFV
jgi:hypothetical protein